MLQDNTCFEKNSQDLSKLYKKYFIQRKKTFLGKKVERLKWKIGASLFGIKKSILTAHQLNYINKKFLFVFDQDNYLRANEDLKKSLERDEFDTPLEHFILFGCDEVKKGKRRIGSAFPHMTEAEYAKANPDVVLAVKRGEFSSVFEHFILFGYEEFLCGERELPGTYTFEWTESLKKHVKSYFDEAGYLDLNPDVVSAIEKGEFISGWEHFILLGVEEVRRGERSFYPLVPKQSDRLYALHNQDIFDSEKYGEISSPFEHFLRYGAEEMIAGKRYIQGFEIYRYKKPRLTMKIKKEIECFTSHPLISVVMPVYNVDAKWLQLGINSLKRQWYPYWELCIADDASSKTETVDFLASIDDPQIKIVYLKENVNISEASNAALELASGDYIALMDNDDELTVDAFYEVVKVINKSNTEFIYSDEDKLELDGRYSDPHFKPDFAPDMFLSQNYLSHLGVVKKSLIDEVGGWTVGLEGAQDYDLYLKVLELTNKIVHIPKVLYHWRKIPGSTAAEFSDKSYAQDAGQKALQNAMKRRGIQAEVLAAKHPGTYRIKYTIDKSIDLTVNIQDIASETTLPLVSIVIPFKDKSELLDMCIHSILDRSTYQNYEIIGISNNSEESETFEMMEKLKGKDKRVSFYEYNIPFNYSAINNYAVNKYAKGEHILLLNNDIEIISPEWIESMLEFSQREDVGVVGSKLYYPNDTIQHAGVAIGVLILAGHSFRHLARDTPGYMGRESVIQNISAVTAACLMVKKTIFDSMNGLNENDLKIAFNDIDFCLRIQEQGYLNVFTPYCEAYHYESVSRGKDDDPEKVARFNSEVEYMLERHRKILNTGDPYYNPSLTLKSENFGLV